MKSILEKIKEVTVFANIEVDYDSPMAPSQFATKKRAIEDLEALNAEYTEKLKEETVAIVVTGDLSNDFVSMAEESGVLSANLDSSINTVLSSLNEDIYLNQPISLDTVILADSIITEMARSNGVRSVGINLERVKQDVMVDSKSQFINIITDLLIESDPSVILNMAMTSISKVALENEVGKKSGVFPVLFTTSNSKIAESTKNTQNFKKVVLISAGQSNLNGVEFNLEKVDEDTVKKTLQLIKKSLKEK